MQSAIVVVIWLENEHVDEEICRRAKNQESLRQRQSGAAENRAAGLIQLGVVMQA